jgi:uncharacterized protein
MAKVIDIHIHFGAPGQNGSQVHGCYWSPNFEKTAAYWAFRLITGTLFGKIDFDRAKSTMSAVVGSSTKVDKCVFLALDQVYDEHGDTDLTNWTNLYVENKTIVELAASNPRILFGASIHPYRLDWQAELDYCLDNKAVLCKWLPSAQCIDPDHPKCIPFYQALAACNLPLLCHVGPELSIPTSNNYYEQFNNAKHLRRALSEGVTVIFAHSSLPFEPASLDGDDAYQQFKAIMDEAKTHGYGDQWKAYADISALCLLRSSYVPTLLRDVEASQLIFGSDYPIPMIDFAHKEVPSIWDWISHFWETLTAKNMLDKNYLLLEDMGFPPEVFTAAEELFAKIDYPPSI